MLPRRAASIVLPQPGGPTRSSGARVRAEIRGFGESSDAGHITRPDPEAQARAIRNALAEHEYFPHGASLFPEWPIWRPDWARGRIALQVDLKHGFEDPGDDRLEMTVLGLINKAAISDQVVVSSWDEVALARLRASQPTLPLAVNLRPRVTDPVQQVVRTGARWVVVYWPQVDARAVTSLQRAGLVVALTDLVSADYREARRLAVDAVTSGDPAAAQKVLSPAAPGRWALWITRPWASVT